MAHRPPARSMVRALLSMFAGITTLMALIPGEPLQSQGPESRALVGGQVIDATTNRPVAAADVRLIPVGTGIAAASGDVLDVELPESDAARAGMSSPPAQRTRPDGTFTFSNLGAGQYSLQVRHRSYLPASYGQRAHNTAPRYLRLTAGQQRTGLIVYAWKLGRVSGRVTDERGEAVVDVAVRLLRETQRGGAQRYTPDNSVDTDDQGNYRFDDVKPGRYRVAVPSSVATMPRALFDAYEAADENRAGLMVRGLLARGATMPFADGIQIGNHSFEWRGPVGRVESLAGAGDHVAAVYPTSFSPSSQSALGAAVFVMEPGADLSSVDVTLRPLPSKMVSGVLMGPDGPAAGVGLRLVSAALGPLATDRGLEAASAVTDGAGGFSFLGVPPGDYVLKALTAASWTPVAGTAAWLLSIESVGSVHRGPSRPADESLFWAETVVSVGETSLSKLQVMLRPGIRLSGRVEFEGAAAPPSEKELSWMTLSLSAIDTDLSTFLAPSFGRLNAERRFTSAPYPPGRYSLSLSAPRGWRVKAIMVGGRDVYGESLELGTDDIEGVVIVLTDRETRVSGSVRASGPDQDLDSTIVMFPDDYESWIRNGMSDRKSRRAMADAAGQFTIRNILPGSYLIVALPPDRPVDLQHPDFVRQLAGSARRITIKEGEHMTMAILRLNAR